MALIQSISGIRGTLGGEAGGNLTPFDFVKFTTAYGAWLQSRNAGKRIKVLVGRDARKSGAMLNHLAIGSLIGLGIDVVDLGLSTTPTVAVNVPLLSAQGGIVLTASHNPVEWNALKLLDGSGACISAEAGSEILDRAEAAAFDFAPNADLGCFSRDDLAISRHIQGVLDLVWVQVQAVRAAGFKVVVDAVNSTGGLALPALLSRLGVQVECLYCEPNGDFPHNPEPLTEYLGDIAQRVGETDADMGIAVDPDVDRLVFICEDGTPFGEEYTLVAVADYVLQHQRGAVVSNLSSSNALRDVARKYGQKYTPAAVGEVNVVAEMKAQQAVVGGEGNGGVIYPEAHYGRDALVGIALFLSHVAEQKKPLSALRATYPAYYMIKERLPVKSDWEVGERFEALQKAFQKEHITTVDGIRIDFETGWVHLRPSNTEPILRLYAEGRSTREAKRLIHEVMTVISPGANR